jgi:hypothetical protein
MHEGFERKRGSRNHNFHKDLTSEKTPAGFPERAKDCGGKERREVFEKENRTKETKGEFVVKTDLKGGGNQYRVERNRATYNLHREG